MRTEYAPLDISSYLDNEEVIAEFLTAAAEDENPDVLLSALAHVAKARGMKQVAEAAGLGRESLYKTLAPGARPRFHTVQAILKALNVRLGLHVSTGRLTKAHRRTTQPKSSAKAAEKEIVAAVAAATKRASKEAALKKKARAEAAERPAPAKKRA